MATRMCHGLNVGVKLVGEWSEAGGVCLDKWDMDVLRGTRQGRWQRGGEEE